MEDREKIKKVAREAAIEAGEYARANISDPGEISRKEGYNNLVTEVDKKCEEIIIGRIKKEFPAHSILAEESGEDLSPGDYAWIIDPLDGTTNYAHALPVYCTSIGVVSGGEVVAGVVYDPSRGELFTAEKGQGAFLNDERMSVSRAKELKDSLIATGFAYSPEGKFSNIKYFERMLGKAQAVRRLGSAAIDLCYVACGRIDGFWEFGLCPWDTAAGELIVKEAGGRVSMVDGGIFDIYKKEIVATNGGIHREMTVLLQGEAGK